jgi:hypothetical protein
MTVYYAVDTADHLVVKIAANGVLTVIAGNGGSTLSGDGGPAINASFEAPGALAVDASGNVSIADQTRIRRVTPEGIISTVAGNGGYLPGFNEGGLATQASRPTSSRLSLLHLTS